MILCASLDIKRKKKKEVSGRVVRFAWTGHLSALCCTVFKFVWNVCDRKESNEALCLEGLVTQLRVREDVRRDGRAEREFC